ncbi:MAG: AAA family ATPase, partial [Actinomycetota bacterium]|nr:AAA family ATPase [Actinomycetota bacterium]
MTGQSDRESFVGRARELAALRNALTDARNGSGGCVLLSGPPGIGKTRLTQEATREVDGTDVLWGRALDDPGAPPLWPWRRILRLLPTVDDAVDGALAASDASLERGVDLDAARFRAVAAATDALIEAAEPQGLVVVLEDLHWADAASLRLLRHVAGDIGQSRLLIVGTHRDRGSSTLDAVLPELLRLPAVRTLALPPLEENDVRAYLAVYGGPLGPDAAEKIHSRSGGNPLYLRAVTALPDSAGSGAHRTGGAAELRHLVQTTLQGLAPADQELLDAAAVLGEEVDCAVLAAIHRRPLGEVVRSADEAVRKGVLTPVAYGAGLRRFAHAVVRDEIYDALDAGARERLHRRAAEVLEERNGSDPLSAGVIAGHWLRSADDRVSLLRAAGWSVAASVAATRSLAFEEATTFLAMALGAHERAGSPPEERAELLLELATAEFRSGRYAASLQHAALAAETARAAGRRDLVAAAALVVHDVGANDLLPTMARLCDLALDENDAAPALRARLLAQRASIAADLGQVDDAGRLSEQALRLAEQCGDTAVLLDAVRARLKLGFVGVEVEERLRLGALAVDLGSRGGQPLTALWGHKWRIEAALEVGTMAAVEAELGAVTALAAGTRLPLLRWHDLRLQASTDALYGRFDRACELNAEALRVASTALADDASAVGICHAFTLQLAMVTG